MPVPLKPAPSDWPRLSASLYYQDAAKAIDWLCAAFGFELRLKVEDDAGRVRHSELIYGEAVLMVSQEDAAGSTPRWGIRAASPKTAGAETGGLMLYIDDADAHCAHAKAHGATIVAEPSVHDYGEDYWADRAYGAQDLDGHVWWFAQRLRSKA
jgi:uncharacterized glyoxalase superfamily protein PhnB